MMNSRFKIFGFFLLGWLAAGVSAVRAEELIVSAAASLGAALRECGEGFEARHPGSKITFNFAASGVLRSQIESGAPVDVFVSADLREMETLRKAERVDEPKILAGGELVLIAAKEEAGLQGLEGLAAPTVKRVGLGSIATVPAGRYAEQALRKLGLWEALEPKAVYAENVRQVLQYVETGAVQAGFVYRTDALESAEVRVVAVLPAGSHDPILYPIAVVRGSRHPELARLFVEELLSEAGRATLAKHGFSLPG